MLAHGLKIFPSVTVPEIEIDEVANSKTPGCHSPRDFLGHPITRRGSK